MNRRRKQFYARALVLKKQLLYTTFVSCFLILFLGQVSPLYIKNINTEIFKRCISYSVASIHPSTTKNVLNLDYINIMSSSMPVLKSNEDLNKKYALRYGFIKDKKESTRIENNMISENVLELDLSSDGILYNNPTNYTVDASAMLSAPLNINPPDSTPRVLIVHTHTSEAYSDSPNARNEDQSMSVVKVGEKISQTLNENGIITIHDKTRNDYPSYNGSYKKSLTTVENNLQKYPTIEIVLDIHRDYIERDSNQLKPTAVFKDGKAAQIMFVVGTDSMGLHHPNWRENLSLATKMQDALQKKRPGLCRAINIRTERFNHHTTKGSMIIEVGSSANTLEEAVRAGKYIGEALADILKKM